MIDINFVRKTMIALCICMNIDIEIHTFVSICIQKKKRGEGFFFPFGCSEFFFCFSSFIDFVGGDKKVSFFIRRFQSLTLFVKENKFMFVLLFAKRSYNQTYLFSIVYEKLSCLQNEYGFFCFLLRI